MSRPRVGRTPSSSNGYSFFLINYSRVYSLSYNTFLGVLQTEGGEWVRRDGLIEDDAEAAAPAPPVRRNRARPAPASQSSVDQLISRFDQFGTHLTEVQGAIVGMQGSLTGIQGSIADLQGGMRDMRFRQDYGQQWSERMFAGIYETQGIPYPEGCRPPLQYDPLPPYYQARGYDPNAPGPSYFPPGYDPPAPWSSFRPPQ